MEAYIGKCLDSLLIPEFDKVEVLVVNDGSKDRSSEIAHDYSNRYPESIKVIDKPNGNYGSCINAALPLCTGRYVKILDADDTFDTSAFSKFVRQLPECSEDVLITQFDVVDCDGSTIKTNGFKDWNIQPNLSYNTDDATDKFLKRFIDMHYISYSKEIFNTLNYKQTEGISYTDTEWSIIPMSICNSFKCLDIVLYRYLQGRDGQTMAPAQIKKNITSLFKVLDRLVGEYINPSSDLINKNIIFINAINRHKVVYFLALSCKSKEVMNSLKEYENSLLQKCPNIYNAIGNINYYPNIKYKIFKKIRKLNYPTTFCIPFWVKVCVSLTTKFKH